MLVPMMVDVLTSMCDSHTAFILTRLKEVAASEDASPSGEGVPAAPAAALFGGAPAATAPPPSTPSTSRAASIGVSESDLNFAYRLFRHLIDCVLQPKDGVEVAALDSTRKLVAPLRVIALLDHTAALYTCSLISNLSATSEARQVLLVATDLLELVLEIGALYYLDRRLTHLALMTSSNLALCPLIDLTADHCSRVVGLVMAHYSESQVVEAWSCAICNITAAHQDLVVEFLKLGVPEILGRLLLFLGDDTRVVARGLQCLSNLSSGSLTLIS